MKIKTPFRIPVEAKVTFTTQTNGDLTPSIKLEADDLAVYLVAYWRWCAEGKIHFGSYPPKGEKNQYYFDNYHNSINWLPEEECYSFNIQVEDGPDGDTWRTGKFKYDGHDLTIINDECSPR